MGITPTLHSIVIRRVALVEEGGHGSLKIVLETAYEVVEGHLDGLRQHLLGVQRERVYVVVLFEEVQHFRCIRHPEGQGRRIVAVGLKDKYFMDKTSVTN